MLRFLLGFFLRLEKPLRREKNEPSKYHLHTKYFQSKKLHYETLGKNLVYQKLNPKKKYFEN